jgi:hypothetical protein
MQMTNRKPPVSKRAAVEPRLRRRDKHRRNQDAAPRPTVASKPGTMTHSSARKIGFTGCQSSEYVSRLRTANDPDVMHNAGENEVDRYTVDNTTWIQAARIAAERCAVACAHG